MSGGDTVNLLIQVSYYAAAFLFIMGLKRMSSPVTAASGIKWAGIGMLVATLITFAYPDMHNYALMTTAIFIGGVLAWWTGKRVAMTDMPQMIALYNGMGGGAAGAISGVELLGGGEHSLVFMVLAVLGGVIGSISFSGSMIAFGKLQGLIRKDFRFKGQNILNVTILAVIAVLGMVVIGGDGNPNTIALFFALALVLGVTMTLPIGGADMPVVISLYNALTGLAVAFEGFVLENAAMIIAGTVVGSAGTLLTQLMAKAMNRSLANVLFSGFGDSEGGTTEVSGSMKPIEATDVGVMMAFAQKVIIVPGYGMAVAQAQHKVWELSRLLIDRGVDVKFAIHPVAGRMPGHMNVLLAEAGVPYDRIYDADEINAEFETTDVALVIGANDVVNPVARTDKSSPIYGMPILDADKAHNCIVIKRGQGAGFSGIENALFFLDNTRMLYGDGQAMASELISAVKEM
ncbi:MAG: NAD(P) transhydrogenase subunit beta [Chromatiales bacterium]|jgi:NAD(P) transhydrogenase subunit beta|nr:NAD(P) transhydrogenase subunit beta [Chromatiales bacterium]MDP6150334.1 NAD(P)(+) transhydrogenase (Re/Si-specific) subunit beta [Gammaproteobacteria bacterium]MDP7271387.1 NAD(P)(+) transhydrogenase (Re/Si-specific) subunit beta [Gammaproteobacteria bacterium]HJP05124.1 NAD(P)(+) transhydrogenase (Re/Si-specific) subunit beta [Gammaproteobacteria bacterium]